jgi:type II secretory ATPase GspE/PulE/Tfp pilus assembly ATPase PilB-like protein
LTCLGDSFRGRLATLDPLSPQFVTHAIDVLLSEARRAGAGDIHLVPELGGLVVFWRVDGVLHEIDVLPRNLAANLVARLKVLADLLTYRTDIPQEGRIRSDPGEVEMRVSTFPTLHGEKAVVRMFAATGDYSTLHSLGFPEEIERALSHRLSETSGAILFTGPAGSGKTTTLYACLRDLAAVHEGRRSLTTLEDPIEVAVSGVSQSQVNPASGFTLESGLRSMMRQDPEVIAVGEIRDRPTAEVAFQAALTGHLVMTTFHAGSASGALGRLCDMGIEPYLLRSGILLVVFQRLVRTLCHCATAREDYEVEALGLPVRRYFVPKGCDSCRGTGFRGRTLLAEMLDPASHQLGHAIIAREEVAALEAAAVADGMKTRWDRAIDAVEQGVTTPAEVRRVLGFSEPRAGTRALVD